MLEVCTTEMAKAKILTVDDDQDTRRLLGHRLRHEGYEAAFERLRAMPALDGIPVMIVSARDLSLERAEVLDAGAAALFQKPFDYDELLAAIGRELGEPDAL